MADQVVSYAVTGKDDGAAAMFTNVGASIERVEKKVKATETSVEKLSGEMDKYHRNAEKTSRQSESLAVGFSRMSDVSKIAAGNLIAMGTAKITSFLADTISGTYEYVNKLQDLSESLGVNTQDLQIFSSWAQQSGTSVEAVAKAIGKLETQIAKGDPELRKMGVTALDGKEAFMQVVSAMEKQETQAGRVRIANAAFGKGWQEIMPILTMGRENLASIAESTALIDQEAIKAITEMDDKLASMKTNAQALAAEFLAAFGPGMAQLFAGMAAEVRNLNNALNRESDEDFLKRIGATRSGQGAGGRGSNTIVDASRVNLDNMSSADLEKLMDIRREGKNESVRWGDFGGKTLERRWKDARDREKKEREDAAKKAAAKAKKDQEDLNVQNGLNPDGSKKESQSNKDLTPDYQVLSDLAWLEKYKGTELDPIYAPDNMAKAPSHLKQSGGKEYGTAPDWMKGFNSEKGRLANEMSRLGLVDYETGVGVLDATQMSAEEMKKAVEEAKAASLELGKSVEDTASRISDSFADITGGAIKDLDRQLAHLAIQGELSAKTIGDAIKNSVQGALENALAALLDLAWEFALNSIFGGTPAAGFVGRMFKHADGTLNSAGGIGTLSERGTERVITPQGNDYYVTPGLYAMSPGARVVPAENATSSSQNLTFVFEGQNYALNNEMERRIRAIIREESPSANDSSRRTRIR